MSGFAGRYYLHVGDVQDDATFRREHGWSHEQFWDSKRSQSLGKGSLGALHARRRRNRRLQAPLGTPWSNAG